jgi:hypothetical protein
LKRIDDLENLIQSTAVSAPMVHTIPTAFQPTAQHEDLEILEDKHSKHCLVNVEAILQWPVFETIEQHYHWSPVEEENDHSALSVSVDFDLQSSSHLIDRFFEDVHIFNPVLEESQIKEFMRNIQMNGIGWDSQSCLLVNFPLSTNLD